MLAVCDRAEALAAASALGGSARKDEKNKAIGNYYRALDAVRAQGKEVADVLDVS